MSAGYTGLALDPQTILDHARAQAGAAVRPPLTSEPTSRSLAAPVVVRSVAGTHTRVHRLDNHYAWLAVSLHLSALQSAPNR